MKPSIYLDNAATSWPKPEIVYQTMDNYHRNIGANPGRGSSSKTFAAGGVLLDTREALARLFHLSDISRIVFTKNITEAINTVLKGYLDPGDHIIISSMEHNAVTRPLSVLKRSGVEVTVVECAPDGSLYPPDIEKAWQKNTRMVALTSASNVTGTIMPIKEVGSICRERNAVFLLDSAQSAGILPIDVEEENIDILTFTGHKGLFGPQGTGGFYLRPGLEIRSLIEGGTGSLSETIIQPEFLPDKFESGTLNTPGIAGLGAGVGFILETGLSAIRQHELQLMNYLMDGLSEVSGLTLYGPKDSHKKTSVLSLNLAGMECGELSFALDERFGIITRSGLHCAPLAHKTIGTLQQGTCRVSLGYFTTQEEITFFLDAMRKLSTEI
ncbi:aminotransferase class V-fold PLP-dependent enzyme [Dehalobacterium formicoaceticum]|uniref:cysteine desulfurase n=1 Tax=Dehalobacterium formicoaceticum TaxID=51515 RepID=A0ABT1Y2U2_9FIRM|nr:aminotransferase class V-fold PLP-dependent enzyme [Dehalobacterium formicoaceticum]MCR6545194.1 aminotransferase class V-fold PLP-dependent enzyme [Dehalobacterium formicoaceticum]